MNKKVFLVSMVGVLLGTYGTPTLMYATEVESNDGSIPPIETATAVPEEIKDELSIENSPYSEAPIVEAPIAGDPTLNEVVEIPAGSQEKHNWSQFIFTTVWNDPTPIIEEDNLLIEPDPVSDPIVELFDVNSSSEEIAIEKNEQTELFIRRIGEIARTIGQQNNLYASVMIAQAILETSSGGSQLSQEPYYNLFGIKGSYNGKFVEFLTGEDDGQGNWYQIPATFKQYPSYKESFDDYAILLTKGVTDQPTVYAQAWKDQAPDYRAATQALTGVYATDTAYDKKLNALIEAYELVEYDKEQATKTTGNVLVTDSHQDSDFQTYFGENYSGAEAYVSGNCIQYVYNRITQLQGQIETTMGNGMDWGSTGQALGYEVNHTPKAGTAVSFQPSVAGADSLYGHVAFVEHVYEDGSILISEMNVTGLGEVSLRLLDQMTANILTYITPK